MAINSLDFPTGAIQIKPASDQWGPFAFDLSRSLPSGDDISSATVSSETEGGTDTTADLIEPGSTTHTTTTVGVRLQYPGAALLGRHILKITVVLASGASHSFSFGYVHVLQG